MKLCKCMLSHYYFAFWTVLYKKINSFLNYYNSQMLNTYFLYENNYYLGINEYVEVKEF